VKCPQCSHVQGFNRVGRTCAKCGYNYVLSPKESPYIADRRLIRAASRAGRDGRPFTVNQLVAEIARSKRFFLGWTRHRRNSRFAATQESIRYFHRYRGIPGLLDELSLDRSAPTAWTEPDLHDYGAERVLVVDDPIVVDLLVGYGVHVDAKALIVSRDGYPRVATELVQRLLRERTDVPVYVLHASDVDADAFIANTRAMLQASATTPVTDLGLAPDCATRISSLRWARRLKRVPVDALSFGALGGRLPRAITDGTRLDATADSSDGGIGWWLVLDDYG